MKFLLKKVVRYLAVREWGWRLLQSTLMLSASYAVEVRRKYGPPVIETATLEDLERISKDVTVKHGPFKGLKYLTAESIGSVMLPKLLGSYERELHFLIEEICEAPYSKIIDVGCAEGYYAVGFAMRNPEAHVFAFDIQQFARDSCRTLAEINNLSERVTIEGFCSGETLKGLSDGGRNLIICDCESYEKELFTEDLVPYLANSDLIIELHDLDDIEISTYISNLFKETHEQTFIQSIDDIQKAKTYRYDELEGLDLANRKRILAENRLTIMEWVFLKSKTVQV